MGRVVAARLQFGRQALSGDQTAMDRKSVLDKLQGLFQETFDDEALKISEATSADDIEAWDSLSNVRLMIAVEQAFGIRMRAAEVSSLKSTGELVNLVLAKVA